VNDLRLRLLGLSFLSLLTSCGYLVSDSKVCKSLQTQGYTGCDIRAHHVWSPSLMGGCGRDDTLSAEVVTVNPRGQRVTVTVCCSTFKACTIRAD
jgi:hypothetical protein